MADANRNTIPDACESMVTGVLPVSGPSQGGTLVTITGSNFPVVVSVSVGGVPASSVTRISSTKLTAVTPANLPGIADVRVNEYEANDAFYYRPECGSDLDQNGVVDTADISIILLDFGPCYEPPAALTAPSPKPLLAGEAAPSQSNTDSPRREP